MGRGLISAALGATLVATEMLGAPARAADIAAPLEAREPAPRDLPPSELPTTGVPCGAPVVGSFPAVWQGRFQGGYSHYVGEGGPVVLDWRQERLCFPDRGSCRRYIADMRRDFHRPEGYFTCLPIR